MRERGPDEWQCKAVDDDAEDKEIEWLSAVHPVGAVKCQDEFSRREEGEQSEQEDLALQLLITEAPLQALLSSFRRGVAGKEGSQDTLAGGLALNEGFEHVGDTLQRVDTQGREVLF